jgi:hypothetical protein
MPYPSSYTSLLLTKNAAYFLWERLVRLHNVDRAFSLVDTRIYITITARVAIKHQ